jgi:hypothetical protein
MIVQLLNILMKKIIINTQAGTLNIAQKCCSSTLAYTLMEDITNAVNAILSHEITLTIVSLIDLTTNLIANWQEQTTRTNYSLN